MKSNLYRKFKESGHHLKPKEGESLYLMIDAGRVNDFFIKLYSIDTSLQLEPIYLHPPYDALREVSPCLVLVNHKIIEFFFELDLKNIGYFVSSRLDISTLAEKFRALITAVTPFKTEVFIKMAHSETAWVFYQSDSPHFWQMVSSVWLPTRNGWKFREKPLSESHSCNLSDRLVITDFQWEQLGGIYFQNTLDKLSQHLKDNFPEQDLIDSKKWLKNHVKHARQKGFSTQSEIFGYFNVIGILGEEAVTTNHYPSIYQLIHEKSQCTPQQRIEQAQREANRILKHV